ncbi:MAG: transketolase [Rhodobacteraceae bacterium]|nr:transketolase [Paracoccaceae bacterium]
MNLEKLRNEHPIHWQLANAIRFLSAQAVHGAASGHQGMPIGMADVATVLFRRFLKFDPGAPHWPDRDRFILSAGHGSMLLYALLYLTGHRDMPIDQIRAFRQLGSRTAGHPEYGHASGIETTTGPLGQGLANGVGFAMAEAALRARFGRSIVDHFTFVIAGDGCLMEGVSHEAMGLAGHQELDKLIVLWDDNGITIDGPVSISDRTDQIFRWEAAGWSVSACDGHDPDEIGQAIAAAMEESRPSMIACRTRAAWGVEGVEGTAAAHGYAIKDGELDQMKKAYGWESPDFKVPDDTLRLWQEFGARGAKIREEWERNLKRAKPAIRREFDRVTAGQTPGKLAAAIRRVKRSVADDQPMSATRKSSQVALEAITPIVKEAFGGSADLTGSNNTRTSGMEPFCPSNRLGRHVHYGVREHAMAGAMNGMALHGGVRPYGGTFLCFADYARPAMRLSALMGLPVTYVMTHDSIGLGEDGPTHQPVEHLAMLRATPNLNVIRPADSAETAEAWEIAISATRTPTVLSLSRQSARTLRTQYARKNRTRLGAYILARSSGRCRVILMATGTEVEVAMDARGILQDKGIGTRVVSMPCWEIFRSQDEKYRRQVLPAGPVRVAVEAGGRLGWDEWLSGERGNHRRSAFIGMDSFGASAPSKALYEHFGITAGKVADAALALL